jgi:serine/threonine protein kinase/WD40 repeat protein
VRVVVSLRLWRGWFKIGASSAHALWIHPMADPPKELDQTRDAPTIGHEGSGTEPQTTSFRGQPLEKVGGTIGPYKLLDELGEGGMGTVYLAEQDRPVRRRVALKIIKPGLDTAQVIARFEAERQALALMDHPNIARVLDAGTTVSGRPYFVMELVQGVPITSYCDQRRLPLNERLQLFLPVCRAVQHAHQKGIIHRDLKPSNILVTLRDDQPVPKVIDFGIAKATTQRLTERTLYTHYGQLVGTPDYMSPEQAGMGGLDVDTRSDVYSLGAILYELLCGDTPLGHERIKTLDFVAMLNLIYEHEPPPPSRRVLDLGNKADDIARRRHSEPARLAQQLRGELDWITTKALEKERTRRYESPSALAADVERHLTNQPVEASPPSATYRLQKYIRRNRAALAAAAAILVALVGGIIVSGWQAYRATQAEKEMAVERETAIGQKRRAEKLLADVEASRKLAESRRQDAVNAKQLAESQRKLADDRGNELKAALAKAEQHINETAAIRLAIESNNVRQESPQLSLLLAAEAFEAARRIGGPMLPDANQSLRDALAAIGGRPFGTPLTSTTDLLITPDRRWLFGTVQDPGETPRVRRWDLASKAPLESSTVVGADELQHAARGISPDGRWLATCSVSNVPNNAQSIVYIWDLQEESFGRPARELLFPRGNVERTRFSSDGRWLAVISGHMAQVWDLSDTDGNLPPVVLADDANLTGVAISPRGRWAVSITSRQAKLWELIPGTQPRELTGRDEVHPHSHEISSDSRWVATASFGSDPELEVWDLNAEDPLQFPREVPLSENGFVGDLAFRFTPDGRYFGVAQLGKISLWDLTADTWNEPHATLALPEESGSSIANVITALTGDQEGHSLCAATLNGAIYRWDLTAKEPQASRSLLGHHPGGSGIVLKISPSGRWLVTTREQDHARLWNLWDDSTTGNGVVLRGHDSSVAQALMGGAADADPYPTVATGESPDRAKSEHWLITEDRNGSPRLWDLAADDPSHANVQSGMWKIRGNYAAVRADGKWVIPETVYSLDVFDPNADHPVSQTIRIPRASELWSSEDVPLSADGRWYATRRGNEVAVWDLSSDRLHTTESDDGASELITGVGQIVSATVGLAQKPDKILRDSGEPIRRFEISPNGRWLLASIGDSVEPKLWSLEGSEAKPVDLGVHVGNRAPAQFSPDGRWLAAVGNAGGVFTFFRSRPAVMLWDLGSTPRKLPPLDLRETPGGNVALAFSGDGRWLAIAGRRVMITQLGDQGPVGEAARYDFPVTIERVAVSNDGRRVAVATGQLVYLWDRNPNTSAPKQFALRGHEHPVESLAFSPDDRWLVSVSEDREVRVWNALADQPHAAMVVFSPGKAIPPRGPPSNLRFSPDGRWMVHCSPGEREIQFFQLDAGDLLDDARRLAGRELSNDELQQYRLNDVVEVLRGRLTRAAAEVARRLAENPNSLTLRRRRADLLACAGAFPEAIDEMRLLIDMDSKDHWPQYRLLSLLAQAGRKEEFLRMSAGMAQQFAGEQKLVEIHERVAKGALFWSESGADWSKVASLADRQLTAALNIDWLVPWAASTKSLAEYRLQNYEVALKWADRSLAALASLPNNYGAVPANQVKAMALAQLGRMDEAQAALNAAKQMHARVDRPLDGTTFSTSSWHDWFMADIMFREAQALLRDRSSDSP